MTYTVPPKPAEPKPRYVRVTDPAEIEAIIASGFRSPIGWGDKDGQWWAEAHSLAQYRGQPVEFNV